MPGQKLVSAVDGVVGHVGLHMAQPSFGGDTVQLGRTDQRIYGSGAFAPGLRAGEQIGVAPWQRRAARAAPELSISSEPSSP